MCVYACVDPNLPRTGVVPVGPISFNEALVVVFALQEQADVCSISLSGIRKYICTAPPL